jgi:hypothetical protein
MTEVFINRQRVFFKEGSTLKLNIVNTFFEDAGSYTLDVVFPLHIWQNRQVFGALNRIDVSKRQQSFDALIIVDAKTVFKGTAKITGVNDNEVKLQLLSGNSNVKFQARAQKLYIDELPYEYTDNRTSFEDFVALDGFFGTPIINAGSFPGKKGIFCYVPVLDESAENTPAETVRLLNEHQLMIHTDEQQTLYNGGQPLNLGYYIEVQRENICPNLMFVAKWIFNHLGYTLGRNDIDNDFVNGIYIATARRTTVRSNWANNVSSSEERAIGKALPHWTVEEFFKQLQNFLNVTVIFDDIRETVDIIKSAAYTEGTTDITDQTDDEYEVEVIDDEDVSANLYDSNVVYKKSESEYHDIDMVDREIIEAYSEVKCTAAQSQEQWNAMSAKEKKQAIWTTGEGQFCAKVTTDGQNETLERTRFNHFGGIMRNPENSNDIELKISPVATTTDIDMNVYEFQAPGGRITRDTLPKWTCKQTALCLQNNCEAANKPSVWEAIQGSQVKESGTDKEDIMQVFLMDDKAVPTGFYHLTFQMPFTHWNLNRPNSNVEHKSWSLSLANDNSTYNIGKMHQEARNQNRNAELRAKFTSDAIPSVYSVFHLRNKIYACKKMEVQFNADGMEKVINGYFEEIL